MVEIQVIEDRVRFEFSWARDHDCMSRTPGTTAVWGSVCTENLWSQRFVKNNRTMSYRRDRSGGRMPFAGTPNGQ